MKDKIEYATKGLHWERLLLFIILCASFQLGWGQEYKLEYDLKIRNSGYSYTTPFINYKTVGGFDKILYPDYSPTGYDFFYGAALFPKAARELTTFDINGTGDNFRIHTKMSNYLDIKIFEPDYDGYVRYYAVMTDALDSPVGDECNFPLDGAKTFSGKYSGFPFDEDYYWEFSVDRTNWKPFPIQYQKEVTLTARELFGGSELEIENYIGQYVYVRTGTEFLFRNDERVPDAVSKVVQYKIVRSSPTIELVSTTKPTCSGNGNGRATFQLGRSLYPSEVLHFYLSENGSPKTAVDLTRDNLPNGNIFEYPVDLYPGIYDVEYQSRYPDVPALSQKLKDFVTIGTTDAVKLTATHANITCNGSKNGTITLSATGGAKSYSYTLTADRYSKTDSFKLGNNVVIPISSPKTYAVVVTDKNGCSAVKDVNSKDDPAAIVVKEPASLSIKDTLISHVTCNGNADGSITVAPSGGTRPYKYAWTDEKGIPAGTDSVVTRLKAGTYRLILTDGNYSAASPNTGCVFSKSFTIKQPDELVISSVSKPNDCNGKADGKIVVTATGGAPIGAPTYTYKWSKKNDAGTFIVLPDETTNSISNREGGTYKVTVTDANNNSVDKEIPLNDPPAISISSTSIKNVSCTGSNTGEITVNATGGSGTLSYSWAGRTETSNTITKLPAGYYTVTIKDEKLCSTTFDPIYVPEPKELPTIKITSAINPTSFGGSNGSLAISASGGTGVYTYTWKKDDKPLPLPSLTSLYAGNYSVTITDANGCQSSPATATLTNPVPPIILSNTKANVTCYQGNNGDISVSVSRDPSFTQPITYTYQWYKDDILLTQFTTNKATELTAGKYKIVVTDNYNISNSITPELSEIYPPIIPTLATKDVTCNGKANGSAEVTSITGGTEPYTYLWSNGDKTPSISDLQSGFYTVTVTDSHHCSATSSAIEVKQPDQLTVTLKPYNPNGFNKGNGSITAEVKGGTTDYSYDWSGKDFTGADFKSTEIAASGLKAGNYSVEVKDSKGCTAGASVSLAQPLKLVVDLKMSKLISCNGDRDGEISAQASGGVPYANGDYKYIWMKVKSDGTYEDILYQMGVASTYPGLGAGTYKIKVEDSKGNTFESANTITLINPEPLAISTQSITDVNCYNDYTGEIHFTVTGGTGSYTYWNDKGESISNNLTKLHAGKHTVKIKDAYCELDHEFTVSEPRAALSVTLARKELSAYHAADAELVATVSGGTFSPDKPCSFDWTGSDSKTKTASGLASGTYKLKVTDNNGCEAEASATFIDPLKVDIVVTDTIRCNGSLGQLAARAVGGEPNLTGLPYKYTWYKHDIKTGVSTLLFPPVLEDESNDSLATDLPEGHYSVEIDDGHGRILQTVPFHLTQPEMVQISVDSTNVSCKGENNGSIRVTASGGNGEYTYLWEDGSTQKERTNLPRGKYTVSVQDSKGCQPVPASQMISITEPDKQLTLSLQKRDVLVACDGKIEAIAAGGTRPYRFRWNDGKETVDSVKTLLCDGNYKVEVIDKNLCTATASILLPPPLVVKISVQDSVKCFGDNNGSLVVYAQGGVPYKTGKPYKYSWKKQNASGMYEELTVEKDSAARLTAGWYALNITDSIGVTLRADSVFYLPQPEALAIRIQKTDVLCHGASTGAISAVVTGGLKPYRLLWNTGSTDAELQSIKAGVYTITATDRNGCTKQYTATIDQSDSLIIGFTKTIAPSSAGSCDGSLTASVLGGVGPYTYQWSTNNPDGATADKLCRGSYTVTVNDMFGCPAQVTKNLNDAPPPFVVSLYVKDSISCHGAATGTIAARVSGGIPFTTGKPYTYIWKKKNSVGEYRSIANSNDSIIGNLTTGWYAFNVQDSDKNILSESIEIYLPEPDTLALTVSHTDIPCKDLHNGSASVRVSGGVLPYAYKWSNGETSPAIDKLAPGEYWIEVTDKHGCISRQSVTITEPGLLSVSFQPKLISEHNVCDGSLKTVVSGGTAPFSYAWSGVSSTADAVSSLCAGEYSVTVTDAHGCSANQKITLSNPPALRLSLEVQDSIKCNGNVQGVLVATAQGGIPFVSGKKYRYTWKKKNNRGLFETMPAYVDSMATDLATGTYACNITDANGISLHQDSVILLPEPTELQLVVQQTNIGCSGADEGSATVIPSGGSLPYSYAWSTGDKTATVRNLSAGPYIVRVTDRNGCVAARQMYISKAAPLYLFLYKKQPVCYQSCDGEIKTTVSGGIAPYSFRWTGSASTGSEAGSLCAGKYSLLVTDAAGCTIQKNDSLQHPAQLALDLGADRYICSGQTIRYDISIPSKTGITYRWAGPDGFTATTPAVNLTQPGTYSASVTNTAGCSNSGTVTLSPSGITVANEFALPTQAFVNEKIVIVNTTYPSPDSIRWVLPAKAQILSGGQSYTEFQVPDTGVYVIKMISYKGVCSSEQEKDMIVSTRSQLSDIGNAKTPFIQTFSVTPNPSHGELATKVVLQDKADVQLKLINILSNQIVFQERKSGDSTYEVSINVTVLPGIYLLLLETPKGSSTMKVIIF
jgi:large repetitive protein